MERQNRLKKYIYAQTLIHSADNFVSKLMENIKEKIAVVTSVTVSNSKIFMAIPCKGIDEVVF